MAVNGGSGLVIFVPRASDRTHSSYELVLAECLIMAGGHDGKPLHDDAASGEGESGVDLGSLMPTQQEVIHPSRTGGTTASPTFETMPVPTSSTIKKPFHLPSGPPPPSNAVARECPHLQCRGAISLC
jgi:hypothetical protein